MKSEGREFFFFRNQLGLQIKKFFLVKLGCLEQKKGLIYYLIDSLLFFSTEVYTSRVRRIPSRGVWVRPSGHSSG